jgi:regulator of sigma E protease
MGHFLAAKAFGIKVDKFYIFFDAWGKKLFSFKRGETEYGIGWLPLGGYVKIAGMIDESMDKEAMKKDPEPWEFRSKPAWQRLIVMIGGIVMNIILGILIYSFYLGFYDKDYLPASELAQDGIYVYEAGEELGLENGDQIIAVNGNEVERYGDIRSPKFFFGATLTVLRDGKEVDVKLPGDLFKQIGEPLFDPMYQSVFFMQFAEDSPNKDVELEEGDRFISIQGEGFRNFAEFQEQLQRHKGEEVNVTMERDGADFNVNLQIDTNGMIGFAPDISLDDHYNMQAYSLGSSLKFGFKDAWNTLVLQVLGFSKLFAGEVNPRDSVASPIGIAKLFGTSWDWGRFWLMTALISMVLAFMNFLPIPALDGGHIVFLLIEIVRGKPVSESVLEKAQLVGMIILLSLMAFAVGNDILKGFGI